jgi:hypothetical protein
MYLEIVSEESARVPICAAQRLALHVTTQCVKFRFDNQRTAKGRIAFGPWLTNIQVLVSRVSAMQPIYQCGWCRPRSRL